MYCEVLVLEVIYPRIGNGVCLSRAAGERVLHVFERLLGTHESLTKVKVT